MHHRAVSEARKTGRGTLPPGDGGRKCAPVIHDVDEALRKLVLPYAVNGSGAEVSFEAPTKDWAARRNSPTVNVYLYDVREDLDRREVQFTEMRDDSGRVTERRPPPRRYKLSYLVTCWTQRPEDEHRLLSSLLAAFLKYETRARDVLPGVSPSRRTTRSSRSRCRRPRTARSPTSGRRSAAS